MYGTLQRPFVRAASALVAVAVVTSCTSVDTTKSRPVTLSMPAMESQQPGSLADPAFFYGGPGITVTNAVYEGLVRYQPGAADSTIEGALAQKWTVSDDGLRYRFELRDAKFASGKPVTSDDVKFSFDRVVSLKGGPAYMLDGVKRFTAPDAKTFVIEVTKPVAPLLDYLASPYGPKVLEKATVEQHAQGKDQGKSWLSTHSAGTGPYTLAAWVPNQRYTLEANPHYWGGAPKVKSLLIRASDDSSARLIDLRQGNIDAVRLDQVNDLNQAKKLRGVKTMSAPSLLLQVLAINPKLAPFNRPEVRKALRASIDKKALTSAVWGDLGKPSPELMPAGLVEPGQDPDVTPVDTARLKAVVASLPEKERTITFYYTTQRPDERMAQAIAAVLTSAGLKVNLRLPSNGVEWWKSDKVHLYIQTTNPDAAHADAWMQIFYKTKGFLNYLHAGSRDIDAAIDQARATADSAAGAKAYAKAASMVYDDATFVSIASVENAWAVSAKLNGLSTTPSAAFAIDFAKAAP